MLQESGAKRNGISLFQNLVTYTEQQLALCQSNDAKSQRDLYDIFKAIVMGLCRRYTGNKQEAEDVFQDAFIQAFKNIHQVRDVGHLEQWIKRIAVNTAIKYHHKNKRHEHDEERNGYHHTNDDHELILSRFSDGQLIGMINELPDGYRMVFNMYEVEGYSHAEISELLGISEGTSRSQLNRSKQTLKNKLKAFGIFKYEK